MSEAAWKTYEAKARLIMKRLKQAPVPASVVLTKKEL